MSIEKILILEDEFEARLFKQILTEEKIPFSLQSYVDGPYNGIWKNQRGWGHIEADSKYRDKIIDLYENMKKQMENDKNTD